MLNKERVVPGEDEYSFRRHLERYEFAKKYSKGKNVFSVACGTGYGEYEIATTGKARNVTGIDYSREAIDFARRNYKNDNLCFLNQDARDLKDFKNNKFNLILSLETIEHLIDDQGFLCELKRLLTPDGVLIISTPNRARSFKNLFRLKPIDKNHVREYKKEEFLSLLSEYFSQVELYGQKIIEKRAFLQLPKYFYLKLSGKIKEIEIDDLTVKPYPSDENKASCSFLAVCRN